MTGNVELFLTVNLMLTVGCLDVDTTLVEHGNVSIDLSPDGKSVVFSSADGDLYLFGIDTKTATRLTESDRIESYPSFSPDGQKVVFAACSGNTAPCHIFCIDIINLAIHQLTDGAETSDILPRFRLDGKQVVFARAYRHRPYSLGGWTWDKWDACEIGIDGTGFSRLTNQNYYRLGRIVSRSDGSIIYAADVMGREDHPRAALYSLHFGSLPRLLIPEKPTSDANIHAWASDPMVASNDISLTFCSDRERAFWYDICVMTDDIKTKCLVGSKSRYNRYPDFFPDGKHILFLAGTDFNVGSRAIYSLWRVSLTGRTDELAPSDLFTNPTHWLPKEKAAP